MRASMTDASGTTTYTYYGNGLLQQKNTPEGQINHSYDNAKNLTNLFGGFNVNYTYDALNRLSTVQETNTGTTTYGYDLVGNLKTVTYPNSVVHTYTYDTRNRLTNLAADKGATHVASYAYTLDFAGHRTSVTELSGRTVNYVYDNIYRLTSETIASDPSSVNGAVSYTYDAVGNRTQKTSTLPGFPGSGVIGYNANDQLTADTYDNDGNTTGSGTNTGASGYVYDFENHLIQQGGISVVYDGDGNRVSKTVAGVTTTYLVDDVNPTGYAQVLAELQAGIKTGVYVYGLERISKTLYNSQTAAVQGNAFYVYDGHGSVRALTDGTGAVTDTYDYDAFGILIHSTGTTPNNYLFAGEQFDSDLHLYYNRARYLNVSTGRFWTMDTDEGSSTDPLSLHKYLYGENDPADQVDPSGHDAAIDAIGGFTGSATVQSITIPAYVKTLAFVVSGLLVGVGLASLSDIAKADVEQLRRDRARVKDEAERNNPGGKRILFHYSTKESIDNIFATGEIWEGPAAGRYPAGAYATDLAGWSAVELLTRSQLIGRIFGRVTPTSLLKTTWFVAFIEAPRYQFVKAFPFIYRYPGTALIIPLVKSATLLGEN